MKNIICAGWNGETRGWLMFWRYGLGVSIVVKLAFLFLHLMRNGFAEMAVDSGSNLMIAADPYIFISLMAALSIFTVCWVIWWLLSMWRCAFNVNWSGWGYMSRLYVMFVSSVIPLGIGSFLDQWLATKPWFMLLCLSIWVIVLIIRTIWRKKEQTS